MDQIHKYFEKQISRYRDEMNPRNYKIISQNQWNRIQLSSNTYELYQLLCQQISTKDVVLKIVVKYFTGTAVYIAVSSSPEPVKLEHCQYKIVGQKIIKYKHPPFLNNKVYLTLHSPVDLNLFKLKYQFVAGNKVDQRQQRLKSSSLKLLNIYESLDKEEQVIMNKKEQSIISIKKGNVSPRSIKIDRSQLRSARLQSIQKEKHKLEMAKQKRQNLVSYKEKSKSLKLISKECTSILKEYQDSIDQENMKKEKAVRNMAVAVYLAKFVNQIGRLVYVNIQVIKERERGMNRAFKMSHIMKKCSSHIMSIVRQLKMVEPSRKKRQLLTVYHSTAALARMINRKDCQIARQIAIDCFADTFMGTSLNKLLNYCGAYRRKTRTIQRYWRDRNTAQMQMFKHHIEYQSKKFLEKHLYFNLIKDEFYNRNMPHNLSWQYLKESTNKIKAIFNTYLSRLQQIDQIKKMNIEIKEFNSKCLKKYIKPFLEVPRKPPYPVTRYFRDLAILKSMLRSWYQIQYRRYIRRMKKQGKSIPNVI